MSLPPGCRQHSVLMMQRAIMRLSSNNQHRNRTSSPWCTSLSLSRVVRTLFRCQQQSSLPGSLCRIILVFEKSEVQGRFIVSLQWKLQRIRRFAVPTSAALKCRPQTWMNSKKIGPTCKGRQHYLFHSSTTPSPFRRRWTQPPPLLFAQSVVCPALEPIAANGNR